ncbi:MAG: PaaI family thioesterase [Burkholderiales bacterium]
MSTAKKSRAVKTKVTKTKAAKPKSAAERMPAKVALPPANRAMIEQSLSVGMGRSLHLHLKRLTRKGITAEMTVSEDHINRSGRINGGILMSFADVLGAIGTLANLPEGYRTTTLESKTNFFAAGEGEKLQAHTVPLHIGRTTMVWQTTVSNMDGTKVAIVTQTQIVIPKKT